MQMRVKAIIVTVAALILVATTSSATANRLSISEQDIRAVYEALIFNSTDRIGFVQCHVTLEGTLHDRVFSKEAELLGHVTRAISETATCIDNIGFTNPNATILQDELPWHISFEGWEGTLPNIQYLLFLMRDAAFRITDVPLIGDCDYAGNLRFIVEPEAGGLMLIPETEAVIAGPGTCPRMYLQGAGAPITVLGEDAATSLRLV